MRRVRGTYEMDFAPEPAATAPRSATWQIPGRSVMRASLGLGLQDNVEMASGLEVRLGNALPPEQEFSGETIPQVGIDLAAQAEERAPPILRQWPPGPELKKIAYHLRGNNFRHAWCGFNFFEFIKTVMTVTQCGF